MGTPKAPQSLPWTPPGPSENLENEPRDIENLHFSWPRLIENTKKIRKKKRGPRPVYYGSGDSKKATDAGKGRRWPFRAGARKMFSPEKPYLCNVSTAWPLL